MLMQMKPSVASGKHALSQMEQPADQLQSRLDALLAAPAVAPQSQVFQVQDLTSHMVVLYDGHSKASPPCTSMSEGHLLLALAFTADLS